MTEKQVNSFLGYIKVPYRVCGSADNALTSFPCHAFTLNDGELRLFEAGEGDCRLYVAVKKLGDGEYCVKGV